MDKVSKGADYAEWFEWLDGNIDNKDRRGYFVTLEGCKIKIANSTDDILGIVSSTPSIIGSFIENNKFQDFLVDEFGKVRKELKEMTYTVQQWNEETHQNELIEKTEMVEVQIPNPNYDSNARRDTDPAWVIIGLLGQLRVRDNGQCVVDGYCKVSDEGIAIPTLENEKGYKVMSRLSENVIRVLFK